MRITDALTSGRVTILPLTEGMREVFTAMLDDLARRFGEPVRTQAVTALLRREESSPTGIPGGVAMPHALIDAPGMTGPEVYVGVAREGVEYGVRDKHRVHVIYLLLSPRSAWVAEQRLHVRMLARLSRLYTAPGIVGRIALSLSADEAFQVLWDEDQEHQ